MKPNHAKARIGGFTVWDLLIVAVTVVLLAFVVLPYIARPRAHGTPIRCASNLKQIGLAFRMWSNDNGDKFPWDVTSNGGKGGTKEFATSDEVWRHFQAISNELNTPRVLVCPTDKQRTRVTDFAALTNHSHLSYFIGLNADETRPQTILSGDRNLSISNNLLTGMVTLNTNATLDWTTDLHNSAGNFALADGSAQQTTSLQANRQLLSAFQVATQSALRFVFPQ